MSIKIKLNSLSRVKTFKPSSKFTRISGNISTLKFKKMGEQFACLDDYEKFAYSSLPRNILDYYRSGAGNQESLFENKSAFSRLKLRPRCLRDVSKRDLSTTVMGKKISMPIGIAPSAMQRMAHPEGECANVRAAEAMGTIYILSIMATSSMEEVAEAAPNCTKWFQLNILKNRQVTKDLVTRAEKAGFKAIVLTVDQPIFGIRLADVRNKFIMPSHLRVPHFSDISLNTTNEEDDGSKLSAYVNSLLDSSLQWSDVAWLKSITKLPIILKGILTEEDARLAVEADVAGIIISNHGGRQVDGALTAIEAVEEISKAVGDKLEIYLDGGVRKGTDVFKALALGAKMVFLGRPALWGLAHSGEDGVKKVLGIIKNEFDNTMALSGCTSVKDIERSMVTSFQSKL